MSKQSKFQYLIYSLLLALLIGGLIMWATGSNPFAVYAAVLTGSFGSLSGLMSVLAYTTPLILTGLGAVVAFQGGVFNIGGEGQLLALIAGFAAGALWALIPTLMVGKNLAALFVGTVMMNSIGSSFTEYLVKYHFLREGASTTETPNVLDAAVLPRVMPNTQFNYGIIVAVVCVLLVAWILYRTPAGFAIRVVGANPNSARQAGINVYHKTLLTMVLSGGICGLAGAVQCLAIYKRWILGFSPGYGWDGITVATLAGLNPFAVLLTGMFFGMLRSASISMNLTNSVPIDMITVLQGLIVILIATPTLWVTLKNGFLLLRERLHTKRGGQDTKEASQQ